MQKVKTKELLDTLMTFAKIVTQESDELTLVHGEEDESSQPASNAHTFIKFNGHRLGRDIQLYVFMTELGGIAFVLSCIALEILLPISAEVPQAASKGQSYLIEAASKLLNQKQFDAFNNIFE